MIKLINQEKQAWITLCNPRSSDSGPSETCLNKPKTRCWRKTFFVYQWPTAASIICTGVSLSFSCSHSVSFPFLCSCAPLPNLICIVFSGLILEAPGHMLLLLNGSNQFWLPGMVTLRRAHQSFIKKTGDNYSLARTKNLESEPC